MVLVRELHVVRNNWSGNVHRALLVAIVGTIGLVIERYVIEHMRDSVGVILVEFLMLFFGALILFRMIGINLIVYRRKEKKILSQAAIQYHLGGVLGASAIIVLCVLVLVLGFFAAGSFEGGFFVSGAIGGWILVALIMLILYVLMRKTESTFTAEGYVVRVGFWSVPVFVKWSEIHNYWVKSGIIHLDLKESVPGIFPGQLVPVDKGGKIIPLLKKHVHKPKK